MKGTQIEDKENWLRAQAKKPKAKQEQVSLYELNMSEEALQILRWMVQTSEKAGTEKKTEQARRAAPVKFDPAQARDEGGRWTTTGAGDYGKGAVPSEAGIAGASKVKAMFHEGLPEDLRSTSEQQVTDVKDGIVSKISDDSGMSYDDTNDFIHQWAESSNNGDMRSLAIQRDAAAEFGVGLSEFTQERIASVELRAESGLWARLHPGERKPEWDSLGPSGEQRTVLRAMYDNTQAKLREAGLKSGDTVRLYRGVSFPEGRKPEFGKGNAASITGNALESWSLSEDVAWVFANTRGAGTIGVVFEMDIPIEAIMGSARTGFGCLVEQELVVLGILGEARVADTSFE